MTDVASQPPASSDVVRLGRRFAINFLLLIALGTFAGVWMLRQTDWFPEFASALALGGVFAWLPFVFKVIPDDESKAFQRRAYSAIFLNPTVGYIMLTALMIAILLSFCIGTLEVESVYEPATAALQVSRGGAAYGTYLRLAPGDRLRLVYWNWPFQPTRLRVRARGYLETPASASCWRVASLQLPADFVRPVLIIRPGTALVDQVGSGMKLVASVKSAHGISQALGERDDYHGETVWVGIDPHIDLPSTLARSWIDELNTQHRDVKRFMDLWQAPTATGLTDGVAMPEQGDVITVLAIAKGQPDPAAQTQFTVPRASPEQFVFEVPIDVPKTD